MATTVAYPFSKINLGLHVLEKRADGYHNIETLFVPHPLCDILEITDAPGAQKDVQLFLYGLPVTGPLSSNICVIAYRLLSAHYKLSPVEIHLYKQIPPGSGLGGGSSDGAVCLQVLNKHFALGLRREELLSYALKMGSDVPFFVQQPPALPYFASGTGGVLEPFPLDLSPYRIELRFPPVFISTAEAYAAIKPNNHRVPLRDLLLQPVDKWKYTIGNDFEEYVFHKYPQTSQYKQALYEEGAVYASMTGSGSAFFGLFKI
ncbi:MAG: 4-(cytidine 5'-diphospho)-2-C-methyl-D-erythritol kinase [Bacteroidales bacterium]|jgi:4-diphosphocytidyl-2-C-methyl-D-erythritol kinase|nr:4-(cytidine 5'-diphospho)-2-C-methyl-D-erythritol kinase [Bacteroidales bacterium]